MMKIASHLSFSACALAASLFLSACGGGASGTDTTPPTVAITAAASGAAVTFSFAFSEDVGTSFTADDVMVTGGTKSAAVVKVDATHYTLSVTPDAGASTVVASVAVGKFADLQSNANTAAGNVTYTVGAAAPSAGPTDPTAAATGVVSVYSDKFTATAGAGFAAFNAWGSPTVASEVTLGTNKVTLLSNLSYEGIDFSSNKVDLSSKDTLHLDIWTPNMTGLRVYAISIDGTTTKEFPYVVTPSASAWSSVDIPLSTFSAGGVDLTKIAQIKLVNGASGDPAPGGTLYLDNLYFYSKASSNSGSSTSTSCTSAGPCTIDFSGSSTGLTAFEGLVSAAVVADPTNASNKVAKLVKGASGQPWAGATVYTATGDLVGAIDVATQKVLTMKVYSPAAGKAINLKLEVVGGVSAEVQATTTKANAWETLSFDFTGKFTAAEVPTRLSVFPDFMANPSSDVAYYFDDISFTKGVDAAGCTTSSAKVALTAGKFASGYQGSLDTGTSKECGAIGKYIDSTIDSVWYDGNVAGAAGDPSFYFGWGFLPASLNANSYFGAFVKAPNNGIADVSAYSNVSVSTWTWDDQTNKGVTGTVLLTGPVVGTCTPTVQRSIAIATPVGAKTYPLALSSFTLKEACGYSTTAAFLAAGITQVDVQYKGVANMNNALNLDASTGRAGNGMNLGKVIFTN